MGFLLARLVRLFSLTYRWRLVDESGLAGNLPDTPIVWAIWHNRIFALDGAHRRFFPDRKGAILTSASKDGEIIAAYVASIGVAAVRGSSSRRGAKALLELSRWVSAGHDALVVPDGPRGPRYRLGPGVVKLAEVTGARLVPLRVDYGSAWIFRSWDRFRLPKPFTTVTVTLSPPQFIEPAEDKEAFEAQRQKIEQLLNPDGETE